MEGEAPAEPLRLGSAGASPSQRTQFRLGGSLALPVLVQLPVFHGKALEEMHNGQADRPARCFGFYSWFSRGQLRTTGELVRRDKLEARATDAMRVAVPMWAPP